MLDFQFRLLGILIWHAQEGIGLEHLLLRRLKQAWAARKSINQAEPGHRNIILSDQGAKEVPVPRGAIGFQWLREFQLLAIFCCIECSRLCR